MWFMRRSACSWSLFSRKNAREGRAHLTYHATAMLLLDASLRLRGQPFVYPGAHKYLYHCRCLLPISAQHRLTGRQGSVSLAEKTPLLTDMTYHQLWNDSGDSRENTGRHYKLSDIIYRNPVHNHLGYQEVIEPAAQYESHSNHAWNDR